MIYDEVVQKRLIEDGIDDTLFISKLEYILRNKRHLDTKPKPMTFPREKNIDVCGCKAKFKTLFASFYNNDDAQEVGSFNNYKCDYKSYIVLKCLVKCSYSTCIEEAQACATLFLLTMKKQSDISIDTILSICYDKILEGTDYYERNLIDAIIECVQSPEVAMMELVSRLMCDCSIPREKKSLIAGSYLKLGFDKLVSDIESTYKKASKEDKEMYNKYEYFCEKKWGGEMKPSDAVVDVYVSQFSTNPGMVILVPYISNGYVDGKLKEIYPDYIIMSSAPEGITHVYNNMKQVISDKSIVKMLYKENESCKIYRKEDEYYITGVDLNEAGIQHILSLIYFDQTEYKWHIVSDVPTGAELC